MKGVHILVLQGYLTLYFSYASEILVCISETVPFILELYLQSIEL